LDKLTIAGRSVGPGEPPWVIAEIGANHNGDMGLCRQIIDAAKLAGADAVKFQSWSKDSLISRPEYARNTRYAKLDPSALTLEQAVEKYQFTADQHREMSAYCKQRGITFELLLGAEVEPPESRCAGLQGCVHGRQPPASWMSSRPRTNP
jgi:N-acetylneuraminate synthase